MLDSLFDKRQAKQFNAIAKQKAKLYQKEASAVESFMCSNSMSTIIQVLDVVDENGHPDEKKLSLDLRNKYINDKLEFDDIMTLDVLYKSNYKNFRNKDENNE